MARTRQRKRAESTGWTDAGRLTHPLPGSRKVIWRDCMTRALACRPAEEFEGVNTSRYDLTTGDCLRFYGSAAGYLSSGFYLPGSERRKPRSVTVFGATETFGSP